MTRCWCADPNRTEAEMFQCPAGEAGEDCLAHDYLATGGALGQVGDWPGNPMPVPDLTDLQDAIQAARRGRSPARPAALATNTTVGRP
ncbi:hypothetical protein [Sphaerisporangium aureirubrum]|uniref:hypothetical protein n=1 Tax=Sphaerisporangium aureirubrum TaxID=1544736 RepID=UPI0036381378